MGGCVISGNAPRRGCRGDGRGDTREHEDYDYEQECVKAHDDTIENAGPHSQPARRARPPKRSVSKIPAADGTGGGVRWQVRRELSHALVARERAHTHARDGRVVETHEARPGVRHLRRRPRRREGYPGPASRPRVQRCRLKRRAGRAGCERGSRPGGLLENPRRVCRALRSSLLGTL